MFSRDTVRRDYLTMASEFQEMDLELLSIQSFDTIYNEKCQYDEFRIY